MLCHHVLHTASWHRIQRKSIAWTSNGPTFSGRAGTRPLLESRGPRRPPGPLQRLVIPPLVRARICSPLGRKSQAQDRAGSGPPVMCPLYFRDARVEDATSTAACRLDRSDVDLCHLHHRIERALGGSGIGIGDRFRQSDRRNLPGQAPFVLAPAARALLAAVADDAFQ